MSATLAEKPKPDSQHGLAPEVEADPRLWEVKAVIFHNGLETIALQQFVSYAGGWDPNDNTNPVVRAAMELVGEAQKLFGEREVSWEVRNLQHVAAMNLDGPGLVTFRTEKVKVWLTGSEDQ